MDLPALAALPLDLAASLPGGFFLAGALIALATALLVGFSIPGTLVPLSFTSGVVLGMPGIFVVALGATLGSHLLFLVSRHYLSAWMRRRLGDRLAPFEDHLGRRGPAYVVGARLAGVPQLLVTGGSALTSMSARAFAGASLLGMLPAICLAALAGSAV